MDKINLDISKYSCNELQDIFNITNINNPEQVESHLNTYKNTILTDQKLSLSEKDNISSFLNKVINKLGSSLDKGGQIAQPESTNHNLSFSSPSNALVKGTSDNHPIIANQNSIAGLSAKTHEGQTFDIRDYPPGYINPINIKTIRRVVNVDTRFREPYYSTKSTDFSVQLPTQFKKVVSMRLSSFEIPLTAYSVSKSLGNTHFHVDSSLVEIDEGNYVTNTDTSSTSNDNSNNIITAITSAIPSDITFNVDQISGKSTFSGFTGDLSNAILHFNKTYGDNGTYDLNTPLPLKLGWLLGFRAGAYEHDKGTITSEGICSIVGPKYVYICVNDYTNAANNHFVAAFSSSVLSPHIIARVNYQTLVQNNGIYNYSEDDDFNDSHTRSREYFGPVDINRLHFQILDEYGRVLDFNNMDWSCALTFDVMYD